jgi:ANTAR domain
VSSDVPVGSPSRGDALDEEQAMMRDAAASDRDERAAERDRGADDRLARLVDRLDVADVRDVAAERRDRAGETRDSTADQRPSSTGAAADRGQSAVDRVWSGSDRDSSADDRFHGVDVANADARRRELEAADRHEASLDRKAAAEVLGKNSALLSQVEHLERALQHSREIGMAMGMLMADGRMTPESAFAALSRYSQERNVKIFEIARRMVAQQSE